MENREITQGDIRRVVKALDEEIEQFARIEGNPHITAVRVALTSVVHVLKEELLDE